MPEYTMGVANVYIKGLREAQEDNRKMIQELRPANALGEAVRLAVLDLHKYAFNITHVDTGALRASHRIKYSSSLASTEAEISIADGIKNPRSGINTTVYGPVEHNRGWDHAFYQKTYEERGDRALEIGASALIRRLN